MHLQEFAKQHGPRSVYCASMKISFTSAQSARTPLTSSLGLSNIRPLAEHFRSTPGFSSKDNTRASARRRSYESFLQNLSFSSSALRDQTRFQNSSDVAGRRRHRP